MSLLVNPQGSILGRYLVTASLWCAEHADLYGRESVGAFGAWWGSQTKTGMCPLFMPEADWTHAFLTWQNNTTFD